MTYDELLVLKRAGFKPPQGPGRCGWCGFHTPTQKHRDGCPMEEKKHEPLVDTRSLASNERCNF